MVTKEQFMNGLLTYIDNEIIPKLSTAGKWGVGAFVVLASSNGINIINSMLQNDVAKALCITNDDGFIDIDLLSKALTTSSKQYGNLQICIPVLGTMTFGEADIESAKRYIIGGAEQ